jgi:hypothetical protein
MVDERLDSIQQGMGVPAESGLGKAAEAEREQAAASGPAIGGAMGGTSDTDTAGDEAALNAALNAEQRAEEEEAERHGGTGTDGA